MYIQCTGAEASAEVANDCYWDIHELNQRGWGFNLPTPAYFWFSIRIVNRNLNVLSSSL